MKKKKSSSKEKAQKSSASKEVLSSVEALAAGNESLQSLQSIQEQLDAMIKHRKKERRQNQALQDQVAAITTQLEQAGEGEISPLQQGELKEVRKALQQQSDLFAEKQRQLGDEIALCTDLIKRVEQRFAKLKGEWLETHQKTEKLDIDCEEIYRKAVSLDQKLQQFAERLYQPEKVMAELPQQLEKLQKLVSRLQKNQSSEQEKSRQRQLASEEESSARLQQLDGQITQLTLQEREQEEAIQQQREELKQIAEERKGNKKAAYALRQELLQEIIAQSKITLESALTSAKVSAEELLLQQKQALEAKSNAVVEQLDQKIEAIQQQSEQIPQLAQELAGLSSAVDALSSLLEEEQQAFAGERASVDELLQSLGQEVNTLSTRQTEEILPLKGAMETLEQQLQQLRSEVDGEITALSQQSDEVTPFQRELESQKSDIEQLAVELRDLIAAQGETVAPLTLKLSSLEAGVSAITARLDEVEPLRTTVDRLEETLQQLKAEAAAQLQRQDEAIPALDAQLQRLEAKGEQLQQELTQQRQSVERGRGKMARLDEKIDLIRQQLEEELRSAEVRQEEQLPQVEAEIETLRANLNKLSGAVDQQQQLLQQQEEKLEREGDHTIRLLQQLEEKMDSLFSELQQRYSAEQIRNDEALQQLTIRQEESQQRLGDLAAITGTLHPLLTDIHGQYSAVRKETEALQQEQRQEQARGEALAKRIEVLEPLEEISSNQQALLQQLRDTQQQYAEEQRRLLETDTEQSLDINELDLNQQQLQLDLESVAKQQKDQQQQIIDNEDTLFAGMRSLLLRWRIAAVAILLSFALSAYLYLMPQHSSSRTVAVAPTVIVPKATVQSDGNAETTAAVTALNARIGELEMQLTEMRGESHTERPKPDSLWEHQRQQLQEEIRQLQQEQKRLRQELKLVGERRNRTAAQPQPQPQKQPLEERQAEEISPLPVIELPDKNGSYYTIQLIGAKKMGSIDAFLRQVEKDTPLTLYQVATRENPWFVITSGRYPSLAEALQGLKQRSDWVGRYRAWVRKIP
ncbi:MAG: hypothetical protein HQL48_05340 [Gammaproteobacteria bacterium]|nr:hypothetical protein [Gammaproteobacteria bacterium]